MTFEARRRDRPSEAAYTGLEGKFTPLERANLHNTSVTADTDILTTALSPANKPCLLRIQCAFVASGVFKARITKAGNTQTVLFNSGGSLIANALYILDMLVHDGDTVNFWYSVNTTLQVLRVQEIVGASQ